MAKNATCQIKVSLSGAGKSGVVAGNLSYASLPLPLTGTVVTTVSGGSQQLASNVSFMQGTNVLAEPASYNFGSLSAKDSQQLILNIKNTGTLATASSSATLASSTHFSIIYNQCSNKILAINASCQVRVLFSATGKAPGSYSTTLSFAGEVLTLNASVSGAVVKPLAPVVTMTLSPDNQNLTVTSTCKTDLFGLYIDFSYPYSGTETSFVAPYSLIGGVLHEDLGVRPSAMCVPTGINNEGLATIVIPVIDGMRGKTLSVQALEKGAVVFNESTNSDLSNLASVQVPVASNEKLVLVADASGYGSEIWLSDGTVSGTTILKDINAGTSSSVYYIYPINNKLYFSASSSGRSVPYVSDGTTQGTTLIFNNYSSGSSGGMNTPIALNNLILFSSHDQLSGEELWKTDGTSAGTSLVKDLFLGANNSALTNGAFLHKTVVNNKLLFNAYLSNSSETQLMTTDGTANGTTMIPLSAPNTGNCGNYGDNYSCSMADSSCSWSPNYATASCSSFGDEYSCYYGTQGACNWEPNYQYCGDLQDEASCSGNSNGACSWQTQQDQCMYYFGDEFSCSSQPGCNWNSNDMMCEGSFAAYGYCDGYYYEAGPATCTGGDIQYEDGGSCTGGDFQYYDRQVINSFANINNKAVFSAMNMSTGMATVYSSDGTAEGTEELVSMGSSFGFDYSFKVNNSVYFCERNSGGAPTSGLWISDGTAPGTYSVATGFMCSNYYSQLDSTRFVFSAANASGNWELWISNGTSAGTFELKNIRAGTVGSSPRAFARLGNSVLFAADDGVNGRELWITDGTSSGTVLLKNINPGAASAGVYGLTSYKNKVYFIANDGVNGYELWVTDGTANGTLLFKDFKTGAANGFPSYEVENIINVLK